MRLARAEIPSVYALTPNRESGDLPGIINSLIRGGARWIQIREKWMSDREAIRWVTDVVASVPPGVRIIVNDRIDLAIGSGAWGVHLGDRDLPPEIVPEISGELIVGASTHSVEEAVRVSRSESVDYVAIGPIFSSSTKMVRDALGIEAIERSRDEIEKPIVAIGGIDHSNIESVIRAGADSVAVISALYESGMIEDNVRELLARASDVRG